MSSQLIDREIINVFIIDDHYLINDGFNQLFDPELDGIKVKGSALSPHEAIQKIRKQDIDVIILDLFIKFTDPVLNFNYIRKHFPSIPVAILTQEDSFEWKLQMFREGVSAYIRKDAEKSEILKILSLVANGQTVMPEEISLALTKAKESQENVFLTLEERELMKKITDGLSLKDVAEQYNKSISALEKTYKRIRIKFHARTNPELIRILYQSKTLC
ncbi:MAG: response regulator transcription factor [Bacteroidota bacterium]|jgi:DNA-binding NarL/FixJ family response regulator